MLAAGHDWSAVTSAGAFVLGATLATIAVLRVMRAVGAVFDELDGRRRRRRPPTGDDDGDD